jgi:hypothetical protein
VLLALLPFVAIYTGWMIYTFWRAFKIRNSVLVPTHRYQALWVAASAIYWIVAIVLYILVPFLYILFPEQILAAKNSIAVATIATLFFGVAFVLAWADATVSIAKTSDPRNRDTVRWRYSRVIVWTILAIEVSLGSYFVVPSIVGGPGAGLLGPVGLGVLFYANIAPYFVLIGIIIAIVLIISYVQSLDTSLRRHLKWLIAYDTVLTFQGLFVFAERSSLSYLTGNVLPGLIVIATIFGVIMGIDYIEAFCLYNCAQSLAPINRFPSAEQMEPKL